jgi:folate-binding protein YgfZ
VTTGYGAAYESAASIVRSGRSFIRIHGRDPVRMVQGLISNDLARTSAGNAVYAAVLTPKGKMVADVRVLRVGDELLLETDVAAAPALLEHLKKFVPPLFARFEDATEFWNVLGVYGPQSRDIAAAALGTTLPAEMREDDAHAAQLDTNPVFAVATSHVASGGFDLIAHPDVIATLEARVAEAGAQPLDEEALEVLRIEAGRPRWGFDIDDSTIPLEAGLRERAISETKGCYTGQEVIVRILHRGHVNWLLRGVLLNDAEPPSPGTQLLHPADRRKVGRITSAARSPTLGQTIALAYVRREVEPPAEVMLDAGDDSRAGVVALPFVHP